MPLSRAVAVLAAALLLSPAAPAFADEDALKYNASHREYGAIFRYRNYLDQIGKDGDSPASWHRRPDDEKRRILKREQPVVRALLENALNGASLGSDEKELAIGTWPELEKPFGRLWAARAAGEPEEIKSAIEALRKKVEGNWRGLCLPFDWSVVKP